MARNNAIIAGQFATLAEREGARLAEDARLRGEQAAENQRLAGKQLRGRIRATLAGGGQVVDIGSALDLTADSARLSKVDELTIINNAEREAIGFEANATFDAFRFRAQGQGFTADAGLAEARGSAAESAAFTGAASTLLSGFGSVAQKWYGFKDAGAPGF